MSVTGIACVKKKNPGSQPSSDVERPLQEAGVPSELPIRRIRTDWKQNKCGGLGGQINWVLVS